jgi:hypothetical protein
MSLRAHRHAPEDGVGSDNVTGLGVPNGKAFADYFSRPLHLSDSARLIFEITPQAPER